MAIEFLDIEKVLRIHRSLVETYGGIEGVRDMGLLHSALGMPQASFSGQMLHADVFEMAAAYLYHIVRITPFLMATSVRGRQRQSFSWP